MSELDSVGVSESARESFRIAAADLVAAIHRHSAAVLTAADTGADEADVEEIVDELAGAAAAYADAQFALTGTVPPLGLDDELDPADVLELDEDDYDDADGELDDVLGSAEEAGSEPAVTLTVLHRADFVVTDEFAVIQAGKEAYHDTWLPETGDAEEALDVTDLGHALQYIQEAGGIEALAETPGLTPAGATTWVLEAVEVLDERDPDAWPDDPFAVAADSAERLVHRLDEVTG